MRERERERERRERERREREREREREQGEQDVFRRIGEGRRDTRRGWLWERRGEVAKGRVEIDFCLIREFYSEIRLSE